MVCRDSGAEEEEDLRIKESELHSFWKSMLPYFAPIEEEDLKLLMPQVRVPHHHRATITTITTVINS